MATPRTLPLLPLRDIVVFPGAVVPLFVGRDKSIRAIDAAMASGREILLAAQRDFQLADPAPGDIHEVGTLARIVQSTRLPDGMRKIMVEGIERWRLSEFVTADDFWTVMATPLTGRRSAAVRQERARHQAVSTFEKLVELTPKLAKEAQPAVQRAEDPDALADALAGHLDLEVEDRQLLLEIYDPALRLEELTRHMQLDIERREVEKKIQQRVKEQMERNQREYFLNEQMKAIQQELGVAEDARAEVEALRQRIAEKGLPEHARQRADAEWKKLRAMAPSAAEAAVVRNYIETILDLPWSELRPLEIDLARVEAVLDEDHFGLERVKDRILEHLAVRRLRPDDQGPRLCLIGPPGVGKTSLARSIARALDLEFVRQSLGGVHDEAEIRGHRRTYVGAMPGRILQGLRRARSRNPVFLLDEIDKLGRDFRGDPGSALLEVLDPEQNATFEDHYLDLAFDLSAVTFVTTANSIHGIPRPLLDRLEMIEIGSYTEEEKIEIARRHLLPRLLERHGLADVRLDLDEGVLRAIVSRWTREAGVRNFERRLEAVLRKLARRVVDAGSELPEALAVSDADLDDLLGPAPFRRRSEVDPDQVGVVHGLAWTEVGGQVLLAEVTVLPGTGNLETTGQLGDVMRESARAALAYVRSRADRLHIDPGFWKQIDLHMHLPEGAVPKDGPSAGIAIATAIVSSLIGVPVRGDVAMTGEITLRGRVLPVGGIKEKLLAAHRAGIQRVLIPEENVADLVELPAAVREALEITPVADVDQVLEAALAHDDPDGVFAFLGRRGMRHPLPTAVVPTASASVN
jgi:ATP-dependent Lon protease